MQIYIVEYISNLSVYLTISFKTISKLLEKTKVYRVVRPIAPLNIKELAVFH